MRKITRYASAFICSFILTNGALAGHSGFTGSEHKTIGDRVAVKLANGRSQTKYKLSLDNGLNMTYGEMISMGDFFGVIGKPVALGKDEADRVQRFINAFNTIALNPEWTEQARLIIKAIHQELDFLQAAIERGESPSKAYPKISTTIDRQYNCATGGGCTGKFWWMKQGRHIKLEETNYDHFGDSAILAYEAGHLAAMYEAVIAHQTGDLSHLKRAYAMNAFACHFLTDRFASGHIRTPRLELAQHVTPSIVGSLLAKFMHDEDSFGLNVHNAYGQHWRAFGDSNYFEDASKEHRAHITEALQLSADEVYQTYQTGEIVRDRKTRDLIPYADESMDFCKTDVASMFAWDGRAGRLYRRWHLAKTKECDWTRWWLGWPTLTKLVAIKGLPVQVQGQLATSQYANEALKAGLINDKSVLEYLEKKQS